MPSSSSRTAAKSNDRHWPVFWLGVVACVVCITGAVIFLQKMRLKEKILAESARATPPLLSPEEDAVAARALTNHLTRLRAQMRDHEAAYQRLQQKKALSWNIRELPEIERDRQIVREFITTNDRLLDTLQNGEGFIRAELATAKVSPAARDAVLERYATTQKPLLPYQLRIREYDAAIGQNALAVLNLLEVSWGSWSRDDATGRIDFNNSVTLGTFRSYVAKLVEAAEGRKQAEDDLANYRNEHPVP